MRKHVVVQSLQDLGLIKTAARVQATLEARDRTEQEYQQLTADVMDILRRSPSDPENDFVPEHAVHAGEEGSAVFAPSKRIVKLMGAGASTVLEQLVNNEHPSMVETLTDSFHNELSNLVKKFQKKIREEYGNQGLQSIQDSLPEVFSEVARSFFSAVNNSVVEGMSVVFEPEGEPESPEAKPKKGDKTKTASVSTPRVRPLSDAQMRSIADRISSKHPILAQEMLTLADRLFIDRS